MSGVLLLFEFGGKEKEMGGKSRARGERGQCYEGTNRVGVAYRTRQPFRYTQTKNK